LQQHFVATRDAINTRTARGIGANFVPSAGRRRRAGSKAIGLRPARAERLFDRLFVVLVPAQAPAVKGTMYHAGWAIEHCKTIEVCRQAP
jgi:hypothetical protein